MTMRAGGGACFDARVDDRDAAMVPMFYPVRAARDAEIRLAKTLAEQVRTRLAATLSQM